MRKPVLILVLFTLLATILGAVPATASPPYAVEEPLWTGTGTAGTPSVWGATAAGITAWECDNGTDWDVFVRGFDGTIAVVPLGSTEQRHPVVQGGADAQHVFYEHDPLGTGDWDVFASALSELLAPSGIGVSSESPIATGPGQQLDPDSSGSWVVYEDDSRGNWDICAHNIVTDVRRRIVSNSAAQRDPAISGSHVVFADRRNGNWDIYDYDLDTRTLRRLTANRSDQIRPQVGQGVVVYQDHRNGNWDIYAYTLSTGKERRLTTDPADQTNPGLDNHPFGSVRSVVYQSSRDGDTDVYVCELKTGISKRVTDGAGPQTEPSISRSFVVPDPRAGLSTGHLRLPPPVPQCLSHRARRHDGLQRQRRGHRPPPAERRRRGRAKGLHRGPWN